MYVAFATLGLATQSPFEFAVVVIVVGNPVMVIVAPGLEVPTRVQPAEVTVIPLAVVTVGAGKAAVNVLEAVLEYNVPDFARMIAVTLPGACALVYVHVQFPDPSAVALFWLAPSMRTVRVEPGELVP